MNENEGNFETLRRLLALKRHEIPPPGYFNNFSSQIIARLRAEEAQASEISWLAKFMQLFEAKPAFAATFAAGLCLLLVSGIVFAGSDSDSSGPTSLLSQLGGNSAPLAAVVSPLAPTPAQTLLASVSSNSFSSLQPVAAPFGQQSPFAQQVNFTVPGN